MRLFQRIALDKKQRAIISVTVTTLSIQKRTEVSNHLLAGNKVRYLMCDEYIWTINLDKIPILYCLITH
jgi:hypothetical protein